MSHWYFCPCCDHCLSIWLLLVPFLASLFPNLVVIFQSYVQILSSSPPTTFLCTTEGASLIKACLNNILSDVCYSFLEQCLPAQGHLQEHCFFNLSCVQWSSCEWSRDRNSINMGLNRAQCVMWAVGCTAITAIQLQRQDSLIRGLSGEHRTAYALKQCEICSLKKCCGRTLCLSSPSTMGFGKDPQQR